jgi:mono/diheme cytochrome c family protein
MRHGIWLVALGLALALASAGCKKKGASGQPTGAVLDPKNPNTRILPPVLTPLPPPVPKEVVIEKQKQYVAELEKRRAQEVPPTDYKAYHEKLKQVQEVSVFQGADGRIIYLNVCANCHGADGKGNVLNPQPNIPNLASAVVQKQWTDKYLFNLINDGHKRSSVVGFGRILKLDQVKLLTDFVRTLVKE